MVGLDGKNRSRTKEFLEAGGKKLTRKRTRDTMPWCPKHEKMRILPDAFGRPTDKCKTCRHEAAGVQG